MLRYTAEEKKLAKEAKKAYKELLSNPHPIEVLENKDGRILTGILEGEEILMDHEFIYINMYYVIDDNGGTIVRSTLNSSVSVFKTVLKGKGYEAENIRNCRIIQRRIIQRKICSV